ncbi:TRM11 family SAM-dependent methyltransferase [Priestia taiwanensis]|uniref:Methyltransferase n=1 Tax=Priestia taiwanensis TaxID=1347902 RepID=A0A917EL29_9BACI|nr:RNA methyltransferase [Priestia taiwanensis]MBM7361668.1 tRNA G10 N-methylase Trm11 [Priestia taiwanensis]GGE56029.1 methyltransferase [Priestia taiwanensis]
MNNYNEASQFIYTYAFREEERSLCNLEMRALFGMESPNYILKSTTKIEPSRSPFIKERIDVMYEGDELSDILAQVGQLDVGDATFKIIFVKINDLDEANKIEYWDRRAMEREIGECIDGEADMHHPDFIFGIVPFGGRWYFGPYMVGEAVWLHHVKKPRSYSTALSTRVARAVANIAVPNPEGVRAIDPCCGIGTVLVEALSMGINIVGRDINPLVVIGSRENIAHFGFEGDVKKGPIQEITETYDVAIIDMPYNLFTHATREDQFDIIKHARRCTKKLVVVTIEPIDHMLEENGFEIIDRCITKKGTFKREILVCE